MVELQRAIAVAMRDGPEAGLALIDPLVAGPLAEYHSAHAARAELARRLGRLEEAARAYEHALNFVRQEPERRYLVEQLASLSSQGG